MGRNVEYRDEVDVTGIAAKRCCLDDQVQAAQGADGLFWHTDCSLGTAQQVKFGVA